MADVVALLQQAIRMVNAGAKPRLLEWHVERLRKSLPDEGEVLESADLLIECIKFRDAS